MANIYWSHIEEYDYKRQVKVAAYILGPGHEVSGSAVITDFWNENLQYPWYYSIKVG